MFCGRSFLPDCMRSSASRRTVEQLPFSALLLLLEKMAVTTPFLQHSRRTMPVKKESVDFLLQNDIFIRLRALCYLAPVSRTETLLKKSVEESTSQDSFATPAKRTPRAKTFLKRNFNEKRSIVSVECCFTAAATAVTTTTTTTVPLVVHEGQLAFCWRDRLFSKEEKKKESVLESIFSWIGAKIAVLQRTQDYRGNTNSMRSSLSPISIKTEICHRRPSSSTHRNKSFFH